MKIFYYISLFALLWGCSSGIHENKGKTVEDCRDSVLARVIDAIPPSELNNLSPDSLMSFIAPDELDVFAKNHWTFTIDRPAVVSVMRHIRQKDIPFWLLDANFKRIGKSVKNDNYEYEIWQKEFPAGEVHLGINGFALDRVVYFVTIGAIAGGQQPSIGNLYPDKWPLKVMQKGAYTYNDWDELVISDMPAELEGHILLTTIRGRAREAAILDSFRKTDHASSLVPDQIVLTWSGNPSDSQSVQWRTSPNVSQSQIKYWETGTDMSASKTKSGSLIKLNDPYIYNDALVNHWSVNLGDLSPYTKYNYLIESVDGVSSDIYTFTTAPNEKVPFQFLFMGDTHNDDITKNVIEKAFELNPELAFIVHSGDHVNTGLFRDQWDKYFDLCKNVLPRLSFAPSIGNHDNQDGLGAELYTQLFMLPSDTISNLEDEHNYSFAYSNARFFMIDSTGDVDKVAYWLQQELEKAEEYWKIVVTHFPPYAADESYADIRKSWCTLYDKYQVDLVLSGHIHQYFRSYPIYNNQVVKDTKDGTIYISSLTVETREREAPSSKYNRLYSNTGGLYQVVNIRDNELVFVSRTSGGEIVDKFKIIKP